MKWIPVVLLVGCSPQEGPGGGAPDDDTETPAPTSGEANIEGLTAQVDPDHPTVVHVEFQTDVAVPSFVRFGNDDELDRSTPEVAAGTTHAHQLLGLKAGHTISLQVAVVVDGEERVGEVIQLEIGAAPVDLPILTVTHEEPGSEMAGGEHVLMVVELGSGKFYLAIADGDGDWVWWHGLEEGQGTSGAYLAEDGRGILYPEYDNSQTDLIGKITRMTLDGEILSVTQAPGMHHAMAQLPDGRFAYLGRVFIESPPVFAGEWIMTDDVTVVPEGDDGSGATTLFDYYVDWWNSDLNFYWADPCPADKLYSSLYGLPFVCDTTHSNSIAYVASEDALFTYARWLDTMLKVDASDGELLWQMSGLHSDFTFGDESPLYLGEDQSFLWSQGHYSHVWADGMMLFDNGNKYTPQVSSVAEYAWNEDEWTVDEVWRYTDPLGGFTPSLGDALKLESGHVLASWMGLSKVTEISPSGELLWQVYAGGAAIRRINYVPDLYDLTATGLR